MSVEAAAHAVLIVAVFAGLVWAVLRFVHDGDQDFRRDTLGPRDEKDITALRRMAQDQHPSGRHA